MSYIGPRGSPNNPLWIILERPLSTDTVKNELLSGGLGYVFEKMLTEARLSLSDCYVVARRGDLDKPGDFCVSDLSFDQFHPPLLLVLDEAGGFFLPDELKIKGEFSRGQLQKYAGSLLQSKMLQYPHYMMPIYGPQYCVANWTERNVTTYVDLQKLRDELEYWKKNKTLRSLPERKLVYGDLRIDEVLQHLQRFRNSHILSVDIETVYPRAGSTFLPHPGYPITIGIADSTTHAISFNLFRNDPNENRTLWRELDLVFKGSRILGQNFFNFDALFLESLGFRIKLDGVADTLIRHHILWPELSHKLQFMTRQYTREPYYKDEGHHWSIKHMDRLRRYNCLDVCVTYEIYEQQEEEFKQRPHLR
jgi:hypothetical protein